MNANKKETAVTGLRKTKIDFIGLRKAAYMLSITMIVLMMIVTFVMRGGLNYGIDFVGGTTLLIKFNQDVNVEFLTQIRSALETVGMGQNIRRVGTSGGGVGEGQEISVDVRGGKYVEELTDKFIQARTAQGPFDDPAVLNEIFAGLDAASQSKLVSYFTPQWENAEDTAAGQMDAQYNINNITSPQMQNLLQNIFNKNIAQTVSAALREGLNEDLNGKIDLNSFEDGQELARALALEAAPVAAARIVELRQGSPAAFGSWETAGPLLSTISPKLNSSVVQGRFSFSSQPGRVNLTSADPAAIARALVEPLAEEYRILGNQIVNLRLDRYDGILPSSQAVLEAGLSQMDELAAAALAERFATGSFIILSTETVGPSVGKELRRGAFLAVILSLLAILVYVSFRFQYRYALAAIAALIHDTLFVIFFFGATGTEFTIPVVAAILLVIGYSLNDTIVVFDRIREMRQIHRREDLSAVINVSVMDMMGRTIVTSGTTLFAVVALFFYGGAVIHDFIMAVLVGIVVGTYSSVFVANPILVELEGIDFAGLLKGAKKRIGA